MPHEEDQLSWTIWNTYESKFSLKTYRNPYFMTRYTVTYVGNMDQILTVRNLNCIFDNRFVLAFLDHKMNPFRPENDYRNNPLSFSLFFVKK